MYQRTATDAIRRLSDGAFIFPDERTADYRDYLAWLDEGNTPEPAPFSPDYLAFWEALMGSTIYGAIREQSMNSLPMNTLGTEFIALIGDAKAGRPNEAAIQQSMAAILTVGVFTAEHMAELQEALVAGHLQEIYQLV